MKIFNNCAAQGDLLIRGIEKLPEGVKKVQAKNGKFVVAHSETGHDHIIMERPSVNLFSAGDNMISYLQVIEAADETECLLEHLRSFDTHETIKINPVTIRKKEIIHLCEFRWVHLA